MAMLRYTALWTAGSGGAGTSTFHFSDNVGPTPAARAAAVRTFFDSIKTLLPTDVSISFPGEMSIINIFTGEFEGAVTFAAPATVTGTGAGSYSAPSGARVRWVTDGVVRGRRVTGTTFLVPLIAAAYDDSGAIATANLTTLQNAAQAMLTAQGANMYVYSRPINGFVGIINAVVGVSVPDRAAVLRSRRD